MMTERQLPEKSPRSLAWAFLVRAGELSVVFLVAHLLGLKQYTAVLSGTAAFGVLQQLGGFVYIVFYGLFVVGVPVLLIAAALAKGLDLWSGWRRSRHHGTFSF